MWKMKKTGCPRGPSLDLPRSPWDHGEKLYVPLDTTLTHKIDFAYCAHPSLYRPMNLLLLGDVAFRICKHGSATRKGTTFHF